MSGEGDTYRKTRRSSIECILRFELGSRGRDIIANSNGRRPFRCGALSSWTDQGGLGRQKLGQCEDCEAHILSRFFPGILDPTGSVATSDGTTLRPTPFVATSGPLSTHGQNGTLNAPVGEPLQVPYSHPEEKDTHRPSGGRSWRPGPASGSQTSCRPGTPCTPAAGCRAPPSAPCPWSPPPAHRGRPQHPARGPHPSTRTDGTT